MTLHARRASRLLAPLVLAAILLTSVVTACAPAPPPPPPAESQQPVDTSTQSRPSVPATTTEPSAAIDPTSRSATATPPPVAKTTVSLYFVRGEFLGIGNARTAPANAAARTAMRRLLAGPTPSEKRIGLSSEIPKGTRLRGVTIANGVATVNLSREFESGGGALTMTLRVAQVVNTLTQFNGVNAVAFKIEGKTVESIGGEGVMVAPSVGRADFESTLPPIMLETPMPQGKIRTPVLLSGSANVFEATFTVRIKDASGKVIAEQPVKAISGTGTRGTFSTLVAFKATKHGKGSLTVFETSAKKGTPINVIKIPVKL